ncbi:MAG TPA: M24 family metallopeptidase [Solirubrobacteraceae bacterium]|nr:M24 family metallopeptidase [Solirubrobacteraceae bacterium]
MTEREIKRARLDAVLDAHGLEELVLRDPANLSWYLGGARVHVVPMVDSAILEVTIARDGDELRTSVIEAPRLLAEELAPDAPAARALPWWEPLDAPAHAAYATTLPGRDVTGSGVADLDGGSDRARSGQLDAELHRGSDRARLGQPDAELHRGSDRARPGEVDVREDVMLARSAFTDPEIARYRALGSDTAIATGAAVRAARAQDTELALAGRAARELWERGVEPLAMLVAGAERLPLHRHPLPTGAPLGERTMLVVCGRRHGLVCAITRLRAFTPLTPGERATYAGLLGVEAAFLDATRPGARIGDIVAAGAAAYAEHGLPADEWHAHHQGGPTGYTTRDYLASPATDHVAQDRQPFAWNPSGGGLKVEDTVLATTGGVEVLSPDPEWPMVEAGGRQRPDVLA